MSGEGKSPLSLTALSLADAAKLLTKVGGQPISESMLREDQAEGAPQNADGTMNLVHYVAWLLKDMGRGE